MTVVYLHQYFSTPFMGGGTRSYEMARRLVSYGHKVHIVTSNRTPQGHESFSWCVTEEAGIKTHWIPVPYGNQMPYKKRMKAFYRFAWAAGQRAAILGGDVIFATSTPLTIALPAAYASRRNRIPMVFEVRDLWPEVPIAMKALRNPFAIGAARWLERFAYRSSAHVVALSPGMRDGVMRSGIPEEKVTVIPNCCDFSMFEGHNQEAQRFRTKHDWLQDRPLVVYTGTFGRINGVDYLIRLAEVVRRLDSEVRFVLVGSGHDQGKLERLAAEAGLLNTSVFLFPQVSKLEVAAILRACDVATSLFIDVKEMWANSANKFFDALAAGKPVAVNHGGWLADLIRERELGLVLDPCNLESAAHTLVTHVRDRQWLKRTGERARQTGRERFDRDRLARQLETILLNAAGQAISPLQAPEPALARKSA